MAGGGGGKIILIPKSDKNLTQPQAYRSISLLNIDYKILAPILAARLNVVLSEGIYADQMGFLKNRQMRDNIQKVINLISHFTEPF